VTPAIATIAVKLPSSFPADPADRLIYAIAIEQGWPLITIEQGWPLITKEEAASAPPPHPVAVW